MATHLHKPSPMALLLFMIAALTCGQAAIGSTSPHIERGHLDLSQQPQAWEPVSLSGDWQFFWQQLVTPGAAATPEAVYFPIPSIWRDATAGSQPLTEHGQASYRLQIELPYGTRQIGLHLPYFYGWVKLFINGEAVREFGSYDPSVPRTEGGGGGYYVYHAVSGQDLEILLQTINYNAAYGGTTAEMLLGDAETMAVRQGLRLAFDGFIFSTIIFMAFYHGYMYISRRHERSNLWFAVFSLLIAARNLIVGEGNIGMSFLHVPALWSWRLELVTYYLAIPVFAQFINVIYPLETRRRYVYISWTLAVPLAFITLVTSSEIFSPLRIVIQSLNIALMVVYGQSITKAMLHRRQGARIFLAGFVALAILSIIEIMAVNLRLDLPRLSPIGMYVFICFQSILLAKRFNTAFISVERSEQHIRHLNEELREQELTRLQLARAKAERNILQASLVEAQAVYTSLGVAAGSVPGIEIASHFQAAEMAGGDWLGISYDEKRHRLYLVIGDVTGHDMLSALVTVASAGTFKGAMAAIKSQGETATMDDCLAILVKVMNDSVLGSGRQDHRLMTMVLLAIDVRTGDLAYANAGHTPVLHVSDGVIKVVLARANPLGLADDFMIGTARLQLRKGDGIFVYTDGLLDNEGPEGGKLRLRSLKEILRTEQDPSLVHQRITTGCAAIWQQHPPKDDSSFVYLRWTGAEPDALLRQRS